MSLLVVEVIIEASYAISDTCKQVIMNDYTQWKADFVEIEESSVDNDRTGRLLSWLEKIFSQTKTSCHAATHHVG